MREKFPNSVYFTKRINRNPREREIRVSLLQTSGKNNLRALPGALHFLDQPLDTLFDLSPLCLNRQQMSLMICLMFTVVVALDAMPEPRGWRPVM